MVNGNPSSDGSIPNAGTNAYVAGYQGYIAKETTFGGNLDVSVQAYTDKDNAYACGIDNQYGNFEANGKKPMFLY